MKLSVLCGTFNPIHNAHISLAGYVKETFGYDKLLVIPAGNPPWKEDVVKASCRMEMVSIAFQNSPCIEVSDIEVKNPQKSYTVITLKELYSLYKVDGKIGFIIGTDAYINLHKWYCAQELKEMADFIVFERGVSYNDEKVLARHSEGFNMIRANLPFNEISSSDIREKIKKNENISGLVPIEVEEYIKKYGLYK